MNPDLISAIEQARQSGVLPDRVAERLQRMAARKLVSLHVELRLALYAGVALLTAGIGSLLKERFEQVGPIGIATILGILVALCFVWVARHAAPFSWGRASSTHLAFDYVLLLGMLLGAADLAYVETELTPLGPEWPWHLLIVSMASGVIALRYDSRVVFSLALSTFAAWRGVSVSLLQGTRWNFAQDGGTLRANALGCGILFLGVGWLLHRRGRKPHFEPVGTHLGWITVLGALASGIGLTTPAELAYSVLLVAVGAMLGTFALKARRFALFAEGVLGAYVGLTVLVHRTQPPDIALAFWYCLSSLLLLGLLVVVARRFKEDA